MSSQQEYRLEASLGDVLERLIDAINLSSSNPHEIVKGLAGQGITTWQSFLFMDEEELESINNISRSSIRLLLHLKDLVMMNIEKGTEGAELPSTYTKEMYTQFVTRIRLQNWRKWKASSVRDNDVRDNEVPRSISFPTVATVSKSVATPHNEDITSKPTASIATNQQPANATNATDPAAETPTMDSKAPQEKEEPKPPPPAMTTRAGKRKRRHDIETEPLQPKRRTRASKRRWNNKSAHPKGKPRWYWLIPPKTSSNESTKTTRKKTKTTKPSAKEETSKTTSKRPLRSSTRGMLRSIAMQPTNDNNKKKLSKEIVDLLGSQVYEKEQDSKTATRRALRYAERRKQGQLQITDNDQKKKSSNETESKKSARRKIESKEVAKMVNKRAFRSNTRGNLQSTTLKQCPHCHIWKKPGGAIWNHIQRCKRETMTSAKEIVESEDSAVKETSTGDVTSVALGLDTNNAETIHTAIFCVEPSKHTVGKDLIEREIFLRGGDGPQTYGHSRDSFWNIVGSALGFLRHEMPYSQQKRILTSKGFALLDILGRSKEGDHKALQPDDLPRFVLEHPNLKRFVFSGSAALAFAKPEVWGKWLESAEASTTLHDTDGTPYQKTLYTKFWIQGSSLSPHTSPKTIEYFGSKKNVETVDDKAVYDWCKDRSLIVDDANRSGIRLLRRSIELIVLQSTSSSHTMIRPPEKEKIWHKACFQLQEPPEGYKCPGCERMSNKSTDKQTSTTQTTLEKNHSRHWFVDCPHKSNMKNIKKRRSKREKWNERNVDPFYWYL